MSGPVITSLLDTDMYKITMHAAVFTNFPTADVVYKYTNRSSQLTFNKIAIDWLQEQLRYLEDLRFTKEEVDYLQREIPYLPDAYIEWISSDDCKLNPSEQIQFGFEPTQSDANEERFNINLLIKGLWKDTILYEIPVLALISEAYFKFVDTDWSYDGQIEKAKDKALKLFENEFAFSEFGTRRRRSYHTQDLVMHGIMDAIKENPSYAKFFIGSSNVLFAKKYGVKPIGTVAHEWFMGIASITNDYVNANKNAMDCWIKTFGPDNAGLALTDTFGTDNYLKSFVAPYSDYYVGVRQDSGDPVEYTKKIAHHYHDVLGLPKFKKVVCYSDSLNVEKAIVYGKAAKENGLLASFGIGTNLTNDFQLRSNNSVKSEPLNIVIKLLTVNSNHAVKISDNLGKNMGDPATVKRVKEELGYIECSWTGDNEAHRWTE
ncbi:hypothetical protein KAFR_0H02690 [Kazachstania africana CBS 2517]|uniref:Nicotinate phosphoribosyltransferase n=1 Tax=Kazachstania africana (strain ATCC 22294 / BCRC 22015 / CBS 2517 / CECT 1963 / NBRC 1671 / NRRL Y-8276) TaxID=1071382 RepID=H2AZC2_KAZAF|nr:hypothetical protein KAFR_0H02690 [Kazachstania africana CBS 2517]CCF59678.1 hypothetical protein KAFR_0H02690 [Kazachstania africana CBS 2517]